MSISVITINFNNRDGLLQTIESVLAQTYHDFEYIIVDGNSSDGSVEVIKERQSKFTSIIEPDSGIYNAMNKGIRNSKGEYLLFLNSGDYFIGSNSLEILANYIGKADIIYGDLVVDEIDKKREKKYPSVLSFRSFINDSLPHPSTLIKRDLFDKVGLYNESLRIVSDWEFFLNSICIGGASYIHVPELISAFRIDGISSIKESQTAIQLEREHVLMTKYKIFMADYDYFKSIENQLTNINNSRVYKLAKSISNLINAIRP